MVSLPPDLSTQIMKEFSQEQLQDISAEIAKLPNISSDIRNAVIEEFLGKTKNTEETVIQEVFAKYNIEEKDLVITNKRPFDFLKNVKPEIIISLIKKEHPNSIALIFAYLEPKQAADVISRLSLGLQKEVTKKLAEIEKVDPEILIEIENLLQNKLKILIDGVGDYGEIDGKEALLKILNNSDKNTKDRIISGFENHGLASELKKKLCDFDDLQHINDDGLREVIHIADVRDLILALKGADLKIIKRVYKCITPEAAKALKEDIDAIPSGRIDAEQIKAAQHEIRNILRNLVLLGKIRIDS